MGSNERTDDGVTVGDRKGARLCTTVGRDVGASDGGSKLGGDDGDDNIDSTSIDVASMWLRSYVASSPLRFSLSFS